MPKKPSSKSAEEVLPQIPSRNPWGDPVIWKATMLSAEQIRNPAFNQIQAANRLGEQMSSLVRVFKILVDNGKGKFAELELTGARLGTADNPKLPSECRLHNRSYTAPLFVDASLRITDNSGKVPKVYTDEITGVPLGEMPVFVRSNACQTSQMLQSDLEAVGESRTDPGGYTYVNGNAYAIRTTESIAYNLLSVYRVKSVKGMATQANLISKPGDMYENSAQMKIWVSTADQIFIEIAYGSFGDMRIPFWLLFRLLGVSSDRELMSLVVPAHERGEDRSDVSAISEKMCRAFQPMDAASPWAAGAQMSSVEEIAMFIGWNALPEAQRKPLEDLSADDQRALATTTMTMVNTHFLPHVGLTSRTFLKKAQQLAIYVRRTLLVNAGIVEASSRDDYRWKRWHLLDVSLVKEAKTTMNLVFANDLQAQLRAQLEAMAPERIKLNVLMSSLSSQQHSQALGNSLARAIKSGEKARSIGSKTVTSKLDTMQLELKTNTTVVTSVRSVRAPGRTSKTATRGLAMRYVQASGFTAICPMDTTDSGPALGVVKGSSCSTVSSFSTSSSEAIRIVRELPQIKVDRGRSEVYVNGVLIGYSDERLFALRDSLVALRRSGELPRRATIAVDLNFGALNIWVDTGRPLCPFVIVRNNGLAGDEFEQWPAVGPAELRRILQGDLAFDTLEVMGLIEYLAPEEIACCLVSEGVDHLLEHRHNELFKFTHMLWSAIQLYSPTTLTAPFAEHSQPQRVTYQSKLRKGSISAPVSDRSSFWESSLKLMLHRHHPTVQTFGDILFDPASQNLLVGMQIHNGIHAEDSVVFNKQAVDRGAFLCEVDSTYTHVKVKNRAFENPIRKDAAGGSVAGIRVEANYDYLDEHGIIRKGSPVKKGTALIGVVETVSSKERGETTYKDASVIYDNSEEGYVVDVLHPQHGALQLAKVKIRVCRPMRVGDKSSSREGNKGVCGALADAWMLPTTATGERPTVLYNSLSFPTRQLINMLLEAVAAMVAVRRGEFGEGSTQYNSASGGLEEALVELAQEELDRAADPVHAAEVLFDVFSESSKVARKLAKEFRLDSDEVRRVFSGLGKRRMYDPISGKPAGVAINMSLVPLQRMVQMVVDKMYAVSKPTMNAYTRQPADGKKHDGGMRIGEMERDLLLAQGSIGFLDQKFYKDSSGLKLYVCKNCSRFTTRVNPAMGYFGCAYCGDDADVVCVPGDWVAHMGIELIKAMGCEIRPHVKPIEINQDANDAIASGAIFVE